LCRWAKSAKTRHQNISKLPDLPGYPHFTSKTPRFKILLPLLGPWIYHDGIPLETWF
jgi:hypothetical protein